MGERVLANMAIISLVGALVVATAAAAPDRRLIRANNESYVSMCGAFEVIPDETITAPVLAPYPPDCCEGCQLAETPPQRWIALIRRGNCSFVQKITHAQGLGPSAVIVYNYHNDRIVRMGATTRHPGILVPAVFVGKSTGHALLDRIAAQNTTGANKSVEVSLYRCELDFSGYDPKLNMSSRYMMLLGVLAALLVATILYGLVKQYLLRNQLTEMRGRFGEPNPPARDLVIALPERIGGEDEGEDCVICLEEFKQGDKIRILPCSHEYHSECIDRWLQTQTQQCPMCKHDVTHANEVAARSAVPTSTDVPSVHCCDCWRRTTLSSDEHREVELELLVE